MSSGGKNPVQQVTDSLTDQYKEAVGTPWEFAGKAATGNILHDGKFDLDNFHGKRDFSEILGWFSGSNAARKAKEDNDSNLANDQAAAAKLNADKTNSAMIADRQASLSALGLQNTNNARSGALYRPSGPSLGSSDKDFLGV